MDSFWICWCRWLLCQFSYFIFLLCLQITLGSWSHKLDKEVHEHEPNNSIPDWSNWEIPLVCLGNGLTENQIGKNKKLDKIRWMTHMSWLNTFRFEATGKDAFIYLSFTALSLTIRLGKTEAKPGIKLSIQINSFSIQLRSWLLQTEMMKTVCITKKKKEAKTH